MGCLEIPGGNHQLYARITLDSTNYLILKRYGFRLWAPVYMRCSVAKCLQEWFRRTAIGSAPSGIERRRECAAGTDRAPSPCCGILSRDRLSTAARGRRPRSGPLPDGRHVVDTSRHRRPLQAGGMSRPLRTVKSGVIEHPARCSAGRSAPQAVTRRHRRRAAAYKHGTARHDRSRNSRRHRLLQAGNRAPGSASRLPVTPCHFRR